MGKFNLHRGSLQLRVLTLTLLFTLGVSIVITVSNMHQLNAEWERTTLLNAEYALQTAAAAIYRDLDEVDDLASWCAYNPSMRTYLLTDSAGNNQALSMYPMISAKYNSMRTLPYIQRFILINAAGRPMMFGTAATNVVALTPELLQTIPGYNEASYGWAYITRDPLALTTQAAQTIPICRALTLPGTDRTAHVCIFVSPSVITAPLRGFTLSEGGKLLWEMGEHIYTVQNNTLTELDTDRTYYKDTRPFDAETLDSLTEVYERGSGVNTQLIVRYPIGVHDLYLIEVLPNGPLQRQIPYLSASLIFSLAAILALGFVSIVHVPQNHLLLETDMEIFVTLLLTMFSSSCVGLLISALFTNGESAILAVLVLMIGQVVFSNVMFTVTGAAATISNIIVCRWGMGALGASTDLNSRMAWLQAGLDGPMYDATVENLTHSWQMLGLISVVCLVAAWLVLQIAFDRKKA